MEATATSTPTAATATATPPKAGRREWIGLAVLALPCLLYSMDLTVLHLAVPALSADLQPTSSQLLWILDIYGFVVAGMLIPLGTLGGAVEAAGALPAPLQAEVLDVAGEAFTQALQLTAVISGTIALGVGVLAGFLLRNVGRGVGGGTGPDARTATEPDIRPATEHATMPATPQATCPDAA